MTQISDEMVEAFMHGYTAQDTAMAARGEYATHRESVRAGITAALATPTPAPVVGEPVAKLARLLCRKFADECGVNEQDAWKLHFVDFQEEAHEILAIIGPAPAPTACPDRGLCEMHDRERRELLTQETVMGQRIMELESQLATATADVKRLRYLIDSTAAYWLALTNDITIPWEGAIDEAMRAACEKIRELSAQLATATADAGRLDWLDARTSFLVHQWSGGGWTITLPQPPVDGVRPSPVGFAGATLRAAIDAARAGAQGGES